jgi:hypothetical protein
MKTPSCLIVPAAIAAFSCTALTATAADASATAAAPKAAQAATPAKADAPAAPADLKTPATATPENAVAFLGDWTLSLEGPNGAAAMDVSLKNDGGKIAGELSSEIQASQKFSEIIRQGTGLVMRYNFDYQGNAIDAEVSLTPAGGKMNAKASFAGGAFVMDGTAARKAAK